MGLSAHRVARFLLIQHVPCRVCRMRSTARRSIVDPRLAAYARQGQTQSGQTRGHLCGRVDPSTRRLQRGRAHQLLRVHVRPTKPRAVGALEADRSATSLIHLRSSDETLQGLGMRTRTVGTEKRRRKTSRTTGEGDGRSDPLAVRVRVPGLAAPVGWLDTNASSHGPPCSCRLNMNVTQQAPRGVASGPEMAPERLRRLSGRNSRAATSHAAKGAFTALPGEVQRRACLGGGGPVGSTRLARPLYGWPRSLSPGRSVVWMATGAERDNTGAAFPG